MTEHEKCIKCLSDLFDGVFFPKLDFVIPNDGTSGIYVQYYGCKIVRITNEEIRDLLFDNIMSKIMFWVEMNIWCPL